MAVDVVAVIAGIIAIVIPDTAAEFPVWSGVYAPVGTTCRIYLFRYGCCWLLLLLVTVASELLFLWFKQIVIMSIGMAWGKKFKSLFQGSDQSWQPGRILRSERRCVCRLPPQGISYITAGGCFSSPSVRTRIWFRILPPRKNEDIIILDNQIRMTF